MPPMNTMSLVTSARSSSAVEVTPILMPVARSALVYVPLARAMTRSAGGLRTVPPPARVIGFERLRPFRSSVPPARAMVAVPRAPASVMLTKPPVLMRKVPAKLVGLSSTRPPVLRRTRPVPVRFS